MSMTSLMPASSFNEDSGIKCDLDLVEMERPYVSGHKDVKLKLSRSMKTDVGPELPADYQDAAERRVENLLKEVAVELSRIHYEDHPGHCYDKQFDVAFEITLQGIENMY